MVSNHLGSSLSRLRSLSRLLGPIKGSVSPFSMACSSLEEEEKRGKIIMEYNMQFFFACLCKYYLLMGVPVLSGREVNRKKPKFAYFGKCH